MVEGNYPAGFSRRQILVAGAGCAGAILVSTGARAEEDDALAKLVEQMTGKTPTPSDRVHLTMPKTFPNGYTVPLSFEVVSPMTDSDHVRYVRVLAPQNPIVDVATFHFEPAGSRARVSTRIRLAEPQFVVAVAELSDGTLLMAKTWVDVASNGCQ